MRNVATGIVLSLLLCIYLCFLLFACFLTECFWRNKDAYIANKDLESDYHTVCHKQVANSDLYLTAILSNLKYSFVSFQLQINVACNC